MRASFPVLRCCSDILIGLLVLATAWGIGFGILQVMPDFLSVFLNYTGTLGILIALGIVVPPLTLVVLGRTRKRIGLALSPVFAATLSAVAFLSTGYLQMLEVRELEQRAFLKPEAKYDMLVLPTTGCDLDCMKVLVQTDYSVVGRATSSDAMTLYRKASGEVCYQKDNIAMLVKFTRAGYAGVCTTQSPVTDLSHALILERLGGRSNHPGLSLPSMYDGELYSFIERNNGKDRLLGRWADGKVRGTLTEFSVGPRFENIDFYSAALGVRFPKEKVFGTDDIRTRVEKLRPVLGSPDVQPEVVWAYGDLLNELRNSRPKPTQTSAP